MRLLTYAAKDGGRPGALLGSGDTVDLRALLEDRLDIQVDTVASLLGRGRELLLRTGEQVLAVDADPEPARDRGWIVPEAELELLPPTGTSPFMLSGGGSYRSHIEEMNAAASDAPEEVAERSRPAGYVVSPNTLIGSGQPIRLPRSNPDMVDWEGEFAVVFGGHAYDVSPDKALDHVVGYTIFNDVGARDWMSEMETDDVEVLWEAFVGNLGFKNLPTFGPLGPCIVTIDEIDDIDAAQLTTRVNGEVMQQDVLGNVKWSLGQIISFISEIYEFRPGDIMTTGTPAGVGYARDPQVFLRPGDEVTVTIDGVGTLRNPVVGPDDAGGRQPRPE